MCTAHLLGLPLFTPYPIYSVSEMASQPIPNPTIDWTAKNLALEYQNFVELCDLMFNGPHKGLDDGEKFSYMVLWGDAKALQLWRNAGMSVKSVSNLQQVLKDYCVI